MVEKNTVIWVVAIVAMDDANREFQGETWDPKEDWRVSESR